RCAAIHNGIIENFARLRAEMEAAGVEFASDTDTECVAHLLAAELAALGAGAGGDAAAAADPAARLGEAMPRVCRRLDGEITLDEVRLSDQDLRDVDKVFIVACGTAYHSGLVAKYAIEHWTRIPCEVELASEFRYRDPVLDRSTLVVAISQSGETMDTLMALRHAKEQKARVLAICNTNGSTIPRESDAVLYTHAGPEIAVASTKAFL